VKVGDELKLGQKLGPTQSKLGVKGHELDVEKTAKASKGLEDSLKAVKEWKAELESLKKGQGQAPKVV